VIRVSLFWMTLRTIHEITRTGTNENKMTNVKRQMTNDPDLTIHG
jgi:hypothetical protein